MSKSETYASVWDAIAATPEEAANLRARAEDPGRSCEPLRRHPATHRRSAPRPGIALLDALVNIATALGCRVRVDLEAA
jgi:hypothetical protein